jgi:uncharacterized C2H2 Zn-finger protein
MANDQFLCQACGAVFPSRQMLDQHNQREHAAAKNARWALNQQAVGGVNCSVCGAQFTTSDQLNRHTRKEHQEV